MISQRTKMQLLIFVLITLVGVSYVGARYARLDRLFYDSTYTVTADFPDSGGIYTGAEVNYRGVKVGQVSNMKLTHEGVAVSLDIDNSWDDIPSNTVALVGNRSAVGEQYVELQPRVDNGPYLHDGSEITHLDPATNQVNTKTPLPTQKLLTDASDTLKDINKDDLQTTIHELGVAFQGTGQSLQQILDTSTSFVKTANNNFQVTTDLLRSSNKVLSTQLDKQDDIRTFANDFSKVSGTLRADKKDLIRLIDNGSASANELRAFIEENRVPLGQLLSRSITTGKIIRHYLPHLRQVLVIYPFEIAAGATVVAKDPQTGLYNAHFGLDLTPGKICTHGYESTDKRSPYNRGNRPLNTDARCSSPPSVATPRSDNQAPRAPVGTYDPSTGKVAWGTPRTSTTASQGAPATLGDNTWERLYPQPLTAGK